MGEDETSGYHANADRDTGKMGSSLVVTECNEGDLVFVRAKTSSRFVGRFAENWTIGFSGVLLSFFA